MGWAVKEVSEKSRDEATQAFAYAGKVEKVSPHGSGHINDTFLIIQAGEPQKIILQRINTDIFVHPDQVVANIEKVTSYLRDVLTAEGKDPERGTLRLLPTREGAYSYVDSEGHWWRAYLFIDDATSFDIVKDPQDFYNSALAFGHFQNQLADFPVESLYETIPAFHDTRKRFADFKRAVEKDVCGRASSVQKEIQFVLDREADANYFAELLDAHAFPMRVTHNDTKLNNILIDNASGEAICVIDLDTVMPGLAVNDYGDSIRFGASTALEDEQDLSKVWCDMDLFDIYTKGFIEGCAGSLTDIELDNLPMGAKMMTFECGMRFLADYLEGDVYFKIHREGHNLDRARTQFKLVADMEEKWQTMHDIVAKYR